jgi:FKBP-type peptidyl-prolyl cis-trans isomerase SlyD
MAMKKRRRNTGGLELRQAAGAALVVLLATSSSALAQGPSASSTDGAALPRAAVVEQGARVQIEYTIKDDAGHVIDSNRGEAPLAYTHGRKQLVPGLEQALGGMHVGEAKSVTVGPEDGFGPVLPEAQTEVPKEIVPSDALHVGAELVARAPGGAERVVRVKEVRDGTVVLDLNHPLAGKTLNFDVRVVDVETPQKP